MVFQPTAEHDNADALSPLPLQSRIDAVPLPTEVVFLLEHLEGIPVTASQIQAWTRKDPVLGQVL